MKDKIYKIVYIDKDNKMIESVGTYHRVISGFENDKITIISITLQIG